MEDLCLKVFVVFQWAARALWSDFQDKWQTQCSRFILYSNHIFVRLKQLVSRYACKQLFHCRARWLFYLLLTNSCKQQKRNFILSLSLELWLVRQRFVRIYGVVRKHSFVLKWERILFSLMSSKHILTSLGAGSITCSSCCMTYGENGLMVAGKK